MSISPLASAAEDVLARRAPFAAGQQRHADAGRARQRFERVEMLAHQKLRRRHQRALRARFDGIEHAPACATMVLPAPTSPCSSRSMRVGRRHVGFDFGQRGFLRVGQREGQGRQHLRFQMAVAFDRAAFGHAQLRADERQRQLIGEKLVIGEALARRRFGREIRFACGIVRGFQRIVETAPAFGAQERLVLPFVQHRHFLECGMDRAHQRLRRQAFRQAIDRLVRGKRCGLFRRHDIFGMGDLAAAVEFLEPSADEAFAPARQKTCQIIRPCAEEDEFDEAGVVGALHAIGLTPVARRLVVEHVEQQRHDTADLRFHHLRPVGAVDHAGRQIEDEIEQPRARRLRDQLLDARPHARKRARVGKKGKQNRGAHGGTEDNGGGGLLKLCTHLPLMGRSTQSAKRIVSGGVGTPRGPPPEIADAISTSPQGGGRGIVRVREDGP